MKKIITLLLTLSLTASLYGCGSTSNSNQQHAKAANVTSTESSTLVEDASNSNSGLSSLEGTYIELFPEFMRDEYKDWWVECIKAYETDDETIENYYKMLTETYIGKITGQKAVDTYSQDSYLFDCYFENDLKTITINGNTISGKDANGKEIFSHSYTYLEDINGLHGDSVMDNYFHVYETKDEGAGQFKYFVFTDDTPSGEYHIEFRYGENLDDLGTFIDGDYAYWMASGIPQDYDEELIHNCIKLFVDENVGGK